MLKLIFVHIPKTGGQSVGEFLSEFGKILNVYSLLGRRPESTDELYTNLDALKVEWRMAMQNIPSGIDFLQDCMHVDLFDGMFPGVPRVTVLREPVSRVVSAYNYYKPNTDIREFAKRQDQSNIQSYLTGGDLSKFDLVGDTSMLPTFLKQLADMIGVSRPVSIPHINVTACDLPDKGDLASIRYRNRKDIKLYKKFVNELNAS